MSIIIKKKLIKIKKNIYKIIDILKIKLNEQDNAYKNIDIENLNNIKLGLNNEYNIEYNKALIEYLRILKKTYNKQNQILFFIKTLIRNIKYYNSLRKELIYEGTYTYKKSPLRKQLELPKIQLTQQELAQLEKQIIAYKDQRQNLK